MRKKSAAIFDLKKRINLANPTEGVFTDEKATLVNELHAPYKKTYEKRAYIYRYLGELQMDILDLAPIKNFNYQRRFILVVLDSLSKFVWLKSLKNKGAVEVVRALKEVIESCTKYKIRSICCDRDAAFYNKLFTLEIVKKYGIKRYSVHTDRKAFFAGI